MSHNTSQQPFTECMSADIGTKDVVPAGSSLPYAAPEVLHALKLATQVPERSEKVNGAAADMWSSGCTLYYVLTGDLPFDMWDIIDTPFKHWWRRYKEAQKVQRSWVSIHWSSPDIVARLFTACLLLSNNNLQAFQQIVLARYLLGMPNPSLVSQHALT